MEPASPARLYASVAGALLLVLGIVGFFYDASFTGLHDLEPALGVLRVNAWFNLLYIATGALGLLLAGVASRQYSLAVGLLYTLLAIVDWGTMGLHLAIGLLGLAAAAGTPKPEKARKRRRRRKRGSFVGRERTKEPRDSEARAKAAGERA
ncbi:MAG TPA: DUF4383 domain-containing protein [Solirubrobacterales bacterium]|nr:DUF4383 domain-containing protein [Solirubrobacterales bacterium]